MASIPDLESQNQEPRQSGAEDKLEDAQITETIFPPPEGPRLDEGPRENEEYDDRAAQFWSVYVNEAKSHDKALIGTWKDDMEGVIIFAGLYSASLTAFVVESVKRLSPDPLEENTYYTRQTVTLLAQISAQLAAAGSPVPSSVPLPPAYPEFHATQSDVRVNVYWFMSLAFSLSAALGATCVQQWVREYVHIFERYSHPLKCARIRQFLFEGSESWHMDVVVNLVPAFIHISLFLFFLGLADFLFAINTATATATTMVTISCALAYLFTIVTPVFYAQSPYQSPLSGVFWHLVFRTINAKKSKANNANRSQLMSTNMTEGRVQLAMQWSDERKNRDAHAIKWVVDDLTEDSELEPLIHNIPDSFNSPWGKDVWAIVEQKNLEDNSGVLSRLDDRIIRLLKTCMDPGAFPDKTKRDQRVRGCIGASLSLVLNVKYEWGWLDKESVIQTMAQVLCLSDDVRRLRDEPTVELDSTPSIRWTCMSMIVMRRVLQIPDVRNAAEGVIKSLAQVRGERYGSDDDEASKTAKTIDECLKTCWDSANSLHQELIRDVVSDTMEDRLQEIVREKTDDITALDDTWNVFSWAKETDKATVKLTQTLKEATSSLLYHLPDTALPWGHDPRQILEKGTPPSLPYFMPQFIPPRLFIHRLWLCAWALRSFSTTGWGASTYTPKKLADLSAPELSKPWMRKLMDQTQPPMEIQLWRLHDLRAGGLFYTLELFIASIKSLKKAASREPSRELFKGTFRVITSKWQEYPHSVWTERLLVDLLRRVLPASDDPPSEQVPAYVIDDFLEFSGNVLEKKTGPHVQLAITLIKAYGDTEVTRDVLSKLEPTVNAGLDVKLE